MDDYISRFKAAINVIDTRKQISIFHLPTQNMYSDYMTNFVIFQTAYDNTRHAYATP